MTEPISCSSYDAGRQDTMVELLGRSADRFGDRPFLLIDGQQFTYRDIDERSNALARELETLGVQKGHCVVTLLDTSADVFILWFAINKIGAIWVPINTAYRGEFLRHQVTDTEARLVVCDDNYLERFVHIADKLNDVQLILTRGGATDPGCSVPIKPLDDYRGSDTAPLPLVVKPDDLTALIYTSGTTGASKGCMMTHSYLAAVGRINRRYTLLEEGRTLWTPLPVFHAAALAATLSVMEDGFCIAIASQFSVTRFWEEVESANAVSAMLMASIFQLVAQAPESEAEKRYRGKLEMVFGVPITPPVRKIWHERFGARIVSSWSYGQTEAIRMTAVSLDETPPELCAGRPVEEYEIRIFDEFDQPVPDGTVGEIVLRPRQPYVSFSGYWKRPEATAAVWRNLWQHTGDLGKMVDGYLYFCDRAKDYLRSRGENISSFEVERSYMSHHAVAEVAVHAVGAQIGEDDLKVTAVLRENAHVTEHELCLWSIDNLPHFAVPRYIEFRSELPKNPTGRVLKYQLRDEGCTPTTWDREEAGIVIRRRK